MCSDLSTRGCANLRTEDFKQRTSFVIAVAYYHAVSQLDHPQTVGAGGLVRFPIMIDGYEDWFLP